MTDDDKALQVARTGDSLERFIGSMAGKYLWSKADDYAEKAKNQLALVNPGDKDAITALQNSVEVSNLFKAWVIEGITSGDNAVQHLDTLDA